MEKEHKNMYSWRTAQDSDQFIKYSLIKKTNWYENNRNSSKFPTAANLCASLSSNFLLSLQICFPVGVQTESIEGFSEIYITFSFDIGFL